MSQTEIDSMGMHMKFLMQLEKEQKIEKKESPSPISMQEEVEKKILEKRYLSNKK